MFIFDGTDVRRHVYETLVIVDCRQSTTNRIYTGKSFGRNILLYVLIIERNARYEYSVVSDIKVHVVVCVSYVLLRVFPQNSSELLSKAR